MILRQTKRHLSYLISGALILICMNCRPTTDQEKVAETDKTTITAEQELPEDEMLIKEKPKEDPEAISAETETNKETDDPDPDINAFVLLEKEPTALNLNAVKKNIGYPQIAKDAGIEGSVVVRILVDKNGDYRDHRIIKPVHPILSKEVEAHLKELKFTPGIQSGKPIKVWVTIPFQFRLIN